jgi:hypothetical protein
VLVCQRNYITVTIEKIAVSAVGDQPLHDYQLRTAVLYR